MIYWLKEIRSAAGETFVAWIEADVIARGAALAYYVLLSLGPLLALIFGGFRWMLASESARAAVLEAVGRFGGGRAVDTARTLLAQAEAPDFLSLASVLTVGTLLFGATAVFANIRGSLNSIWGLKHGAAGLKGRVAEFFRTRLKGFVMICLTGAVVGLSFLTSAAVGLMTPFLEESVSHGPMVVSSIDFTVSILLTGLLFGAVYGTLPDIRVEWSSVWVGAFGTAVLFVVGKTVIARLIASTSWTSSYGPGATVVAFLLWVYLSAQVFFLGAQFTQVWSRRRGGVLQD